MKQLKIGRSLSNDVSYSDPTVSSQHAVLTIANDGQCRIKDLNSTNGTFVNGVKISAETPLKPGDTVRLGNYAINWQELLNTPQKTVVRKPMPVSVGDAVAQRTIGRVREGSHDIVYPHSDVSTKHAFLVKNKRGQVLIVDNNSTNGTYVNGRKVSSTVLQKGDKVMIANKYALNWEGIFPPAPTLRIGPTVWAGIAATVAVVALLWWQPWAAWSPGRKGKAEDIFAYYNKAVVLIYQTYYYEAKVSGQKVGQYVIGKDGDPTTLEENGGPNGAFGTGFFVTADGKIITNRHVIDPAMTQQGTADKMKSDLQSYFKDLSMLYQEAGDLKQSRQYREVADGLEVSIVVLSTSAAVNDTYVNSLRDFSPCTVLGGTGSNEVDLGLIQINNKQLPADSHYVDLGHIDTDIKEGKNIYTIGFPHALSIGTTAQGVEASKQSGHISQKRGSVEFGHNLSIDYGSSGSPIFNNKGRLIGVVNAGFLGVAGNFNIGIQGKHATDLLERYN